MVWEIKLRLANDTIAKRPQMQEKRGEEGNVGILGPANRIGNKLYNVRISLAAFQPCFRSLCNCLNCFSIVFWDNMTSLSSSNFVVANKHDLFGKLARETIFNNKNNNELF